MDKTKKYTHRIMISSAIGKPAMTVIRYRDGEKFEEAICWDMEQLIAVLVAVNWDEGNLNREKNSDSFDTTLD